MYKFTTNTYTLKREILSFSKKISKNLQPGIPKTATKNYLLYVKTFCPQQPVIHIDDSNIVKPDGYKFESLGYVRDGSKSRDTKMSLKRLSCNRSYRSYT